ncbi:MAG: hypothetical protein Q8O83_05190 [bacterium]|nr:hypothetical protein [bacterium]
MNETMAFNQRVEKIRTFGIAYNDAVHDLVRDIVVKNFLPELDREYNTKHAIHMQGGGGQNGSDTTAILVIKPKEKGKTFSQKIWRAISSNETVIRITLGNGWQHTAEKNYEETAKKMKKTFEEKIKRYNLI